MTTTPPQQKCSDFTTLITDQSKNFADANGIIRLIVTLSGKLTATTRAPPAPGIAVDIKSINDIDTTLVAAYNTLDNDALEAYGTSRDEIQRVILNLLWNQVYVLHMMLCLNESRAHVEELKKEIEKVENERDKNDTRMRDLEHALNDAKQPRQMPEIFRTIFAKINAMHDLKKNYFATPPATGGNLSSHNSLPRNLTRLLYKGYKHTYLLAKNI